MKKLVFILLCSSLIIGICNTAFSQTIRCCDHFDISHEITSNCCVKFTVDYHNLPVECNNAHVEFYRKSVSDPFFDQDDMLDRIPVDPGGTLTYTMCTLLGESELQYRIRLVDNEGLPLCNGYEFVDGFTQFTDTLDLSNCCDCPPEDPESQSWFQLRAVLSDDCPDGCMIIPYLNVPDEMSCYNYFDFTVYDVSGAHVSTTQKMSIGRQHDVKHYKFCISNGETLVRSVTLYRNEGDTEGCVLFDDVDFTETGYPLPVEPCIEDCLDDPWHKPQLQLTIPITGCGTTCAVTVNYTYRKSCPEAPNGGNQDVQITRIVIPDDASCAGCNIDEIYVQSLKGILANNAMNFKPDEIGDCDETYRISMGGCWAKWKFWGLVGIFDGSVVADLNQTLDPVGDPGGSGDPGGDPTGGGTGLVPWIQWIPCEDVPCCRQDLKVCRISATEVDITPIGDPHVPTDCIGVVTPLGPFFGTIDCEPACDWNANIYGAAFIPKNAVNSDINFDIMDGLNVTQLGDRLSINIKNHNSNGIQVRIFDLNGNPVLSNSYSISKGNSNIMLDLSNIINGTYLYQIEFDTGAMDTGKFSVVK